MFVAFSCVSGWKVERVNEGEDDFAPLRGTPRHPPTLSTTQTPTSPLPVATKKKTSKMDETTENRRRRFSASSVAAVGSMALNYHQRSTSYRCPRPWVTKQNYCNQKHNMYPEDVGGASRAASRVFHAPRCRPAIAFADDM